MLAYPAIDIRGGRCVRLSQGRDDARTDYYKDPVEPAIVFAQAGTSWIHVVDLDGAFGTEQTPLDLDSIADLQKLPDLLRARGYREDDITGILSENFLRFLRTALP